jgi:hypothetical protein
MASLWQATRELVTDLPVQLAASGFLADALHVRPGEIIGAGELPERLGAPIVRADPAVTVRALAGVAKRPGRAVLRSPFAPLKKNGTLASAHWSRSCRGHEGCNGRTSRPFPGLINDLVTTTDRW